VNSRIKESKKIKVRVVKAVRVAKEVNKEAKEKKAKTKA